MKISRFMLDEALATTVIEMPVGSILKAVKVSDGYIYVFIWIDEAEERTEHRRFVLIRTFCQVPENGSYIGTVVNSDLGIERHVFELTRGRS